jgi:hypothetical protein
MRYVSISMGDGNHDGRREVDLFMLRILMLRILILPNHGNHLLIQGRTLFGGARLQSAL